jgi:hypothetical protein
MCPPGMVSGAVSTDILHLQARVVAKAADRLTRRTPRNVLGGVERRERTADDHPDDDHGPPSAALRPPASRSRPMHRGCDHRDDLGVPRSTARGWIGRAPNVVVSLDVTDLRASELQQEVLELRRRIKKLHGTPSTRARPAAKLGIHVDARASAQRTRQNQDPASGGSCPRVCAIADACGSRVRCQAATGSWTRSLQCETHRTWFNSTGATVFPSANVSGVWPS